jgi:hypothetical protein
MNIDLPDEALKQVDAVLKQHRDMEAMNQEYFKSGLPLHEEIENFEEIKRCIDRDITRFKKIIEQLSSKELTTRGV